MFAKRIALFALVAAGLGTAIAAQLNGNYLRQITARRIGETVIVSASNRPLSGFFDGLRPDPRWDAKRAAEAARHIRRCGSGVGFVAQLLSIFERTVYAQGCNVGSCDQHWQMEITYDCNQGTNCSRYTNTGGGQLCYFGAVYSGDQGCTGDSGSCVGVCNVVTCTNYDGCCLPNGQLCGQDSDCCSNYCEEGICRDQF